MITRQDIENLLIQRGVEFTFMHWEEGTPSRICSVLLGGVLVTFTVDNSSIALIGDPGRTCPQLTWEDWFRFDETDVEFRGLNLTWWCNHKPVLQELVQLIDSHAKQRSESA